VRIGAEATLAAASEVSGLPLDKAEVYKLDLGGGFTFRWPASAGSRIC
jgi:hypothetical protein